MTKAMRFAKLDLITVKPFLKGRNVLIFAFISLMFLFGANNSGPAIGYFMILSMIFTSYPFAVGEQNGIDTLYSTLSVNRDTVVLGRYIFASLLTVSTGVAIFTIILILSPVTGNFVLEEAIGAVLGCFSIFSLVQLIQLPMFFRFGYTKAKIMVYMPLILIMLVGFGANAIFGQENLFAFIGNIFSFIVNNQLPALLIGLAVYAFCFGLSLSISRFFYRRRDF